MNFGMETPSVHAEMVSDRACTAAFAVARDKRRSARFAENRVGPQHPLTQWKITSESHFYKISKSATLPPIVEADGRSGRCARAQRLPQAKLKLSVGL